MQNDVFDISNRTRALENNLYVVALILVLFIIFNYLFNINLKNKNISKIMNMVKVIIIFDIF